MRLPTLLVLIALLPSVAPATDDPRPIRTRVTLSRAAAPPVLEDFALAMEQGRDAAPGMARVEGFITRYPFDGQPGSERTVVYLAYDDTHLYAVWLCYDSDPSLLRAPLRRRDNIPDEDDSVALQLDTFHDHQHLQGFQTSVNGAINDGHYTEGPGWDLSDDFEWTREGRVTKNGYAILMRIPFTSLRFPPAERQEWGFLMFRGMGRRNEADFFPWFSTAIDSRMLQTGKLDGIEVRSQRARWQLTPFATADQTRLRDVPAGTPWEETGGVEGGVDGKLVWEDRLVWDFTVNPDFSQVESDQPQVLTNQRFEVFFPEKRPFFIENASYFATPLELLFTRRIVEPTAGVRLTGQDGRWSVSGLAIEDERPPESAADPTVGSAVLWWAGMKHRGEGDSFVGGALMHRVGPVATSSLVSIDGRQRFHENWSLTYQFAASQEAPDDASLARSSDQASHVALNGGGRLWNYDLTLEQVGARFSAPVGFVPRLGVRSLVQDANYRFEPDLPWLRAVTPYLLVEQVWDEDGLRLDRAVEPGVTIELPHATTLTLHTAALDERVTPTDFPVLAQPIDFAQDRLGVHWRSAFTTQLLLDGALHRGDYVNFVPPTGIAPSAGDGLELEFNLAWFPTTALELEATYLLTTLDHYDGTPVFETRLARLKTVYHFDHHWQLRLIVDRGSTRSDPLETSLTTASAVGADLLLQWQPRPGDAFYFGLTAREDSLPSTAAPGLDEPGERLASGQRAFLKFSKRIDL